jgi:tetratricopeptide (TPR) repeat protein
MRDRDEAQGGVSKRAERIITLVLVILVGGASLWYWWPRGSGERSVEVMGDRPWPGRDAPAPPVRRLAPAALAVGAAEAVEYYPLRVAQSYPRPDDKLSDWLRQWGKGGRQQPPSESQLMELKAVAEASPLTGSELFDVGQAMAQEESAADKQASVPLVTVAVERLIREVESTDPQEPVDPGMLERLTAATSVLWEAHPWALLERVNALLAAHATPGTHDEYLARFRHAEMVAYQGDREWALQAFNKLQLDVEQGDFRDAAVNRAELDWARGGLLVQLGNVEAALPLLGAAAEQSDFHHSVDACRVLALAYLRQGKISEARRYYEKWRASAGSQASPYQVNQFEDALAAGMSAVIPR